MVKAERLALRFRQFQPPGARGFQQAVRADNVGLDELGRTIDGAVDVGFSRQVHDRLRREALEHRADTGLIADIRLHELIARVGGNRLQRFKVARVGQFVEVQHFVVGVVYQVADQCRADETCAPGNEYSHELTFLCVLE